MAQTSLMPDPKVQFIDEDGNPYSGGKVYSYEPGTDTPKSTYTDSTGTVANTNPVILDTAGRAAIWLNGYTKIVLKDSADNTIYTVDNVSSAYYQANTMTQWSVLAVSPTYIGATQFSVPGDYTATFLQYMRVRATISAGYIYGYVAANSTYGAGVTTVTVTWDSTTLDNTLTAVDTSIITPTNIGYPQNLVTLAGTQTLTNKTLTSPTISSPTITGGFRYRVFSSTLVAASTTVPITGLTGNSAGRYWLSYRIVGANAGATTYSLTFNSDTGNNYGWQNVSGITSTAAASQSTSQANITIGGTSGTGQISTGHFEIFPASGYLRTLIGSYSTNTTGTTVAALAHLSGVWSNTANEMTSITITSSTATGIGIGSTVELWAER